MELFFIILIAIAGVAAVIAPILRGGNTPQRAPAMGSRFSDDAALEAEVERYRSALRAGTLCGRCRYANPDGSNFCADCGRPLGTIEE
jgi:hypothetical protein